RATTQKAALAMATQCADPATEIACGGSQLSPKGGQFAKIRARGLGDPNQELQLPLYVTTLGPGAITVDVEIVPATTKPANETCGTATAITPGMPFVAS